MRQSNAATRAKDGAWLAIQRRATRFAIDDCTHVLTLALDLSTAQSLGSMTRDQILRMLKQSAALYVAPLTGAYKGIREEYRRLGEEERRLAIEIAMQESVNSDQRAPISDSPGEERE